MSLSLSLSHKEPQKIDSTQGGRSLRSGRTLPEQEIISDPVSPLSVGGSGGREGSDQDYNEGWDSAR